MREKLLQLLPEIGVLGVPGVPKPVSARKPYAFDGGSTGTPFGGESVPSVPAPALEHAEHPQQKQVFRKKPNEISTGTPRTLGTPDLVQDRIDDIEERAAIMEYDAGLSRLEADTGMG